MGISAWQILLVVVLFLLLFGRGKIPQLMGDLAEGIKSFRSGLGKGEPESRPDIAEPPALPETKAPVPPLGQPAATERVSP